MRPWNDERVIVEYARVNRITEPTLTDQEPIPFGPDVTDRLSDGVAIAGRWWNRQWRLGDIDVRSGSADVPPSLSAKFGWVTESPSVDVPPAYDESVHRWTDEPARVREGALALFVLDFTSQLLAITSAAGDVAVPGFCHALSDLLQQSEMAASHENPGRSPRLWLVEPVAVSGSFEAWVDRMSRVTRVRTSFHLPNPRTTDDIEPVVTLLNTIAAQKGTIEVRNPDGLDPFGHPILQAAISMQERDYGTITADGVDANGAEDKYASRDHPVHDVLRSNPPDEALTLRGVVILMLDGIASAIRKGVR